MGQLPGTNAVVLALSHADFTEDFDRDEDDATFWTGNARCYYREARNRVTTAEGSEYVVSRSLICPIDTPGDKGDVVTFQSDGYDDKSTGVIRGIERRVMAGHPLQSIRFTLEDA